MLLMCFIKAILVLLFLALASFGQNSVDEPLVGYDLDQCTLWLRTNGQKCEASEEYADASFPLGDLDQERISFREQVCCTDGTGCFSNEAETAWHCDFELPVCMNEMRPQFLLYTPEKQLQVQEIDYFNLNQSAKNVVMSKNRPFSVVVHGYGSKWIINWMFNIKDGLIALGNNVLIVRWSAGSKGPWYFQAAANTRSVGAALAVVMKALQAHNKVSIDQSTIIGFSLGAQVAGAAGRNLPNLKRIIGLDPAGPMFQCMPPDARLDPTDAKFVQVIHTNGQYFLKGGASSLERVGHVDIYVNGGVIQPGCPPGLVQAVGLSLSDLNFGGLTDSVGCSHMRAPKYFVEMLQNAVNPDQNCQYFSFHCESAEKWHSGSCFKCPSHGCLKAGYLTDLSNNAKGVFFVNTMAENKTSGQFCGRQYLLSIASDVTFEGEVIVVAKAKGILSTLRSSPIVFQGHDDTMVGGKAKKIVAVVPWDMNFINEVEIKFTAHTLHGINKWRLQAISFENVQGVIYGSQGNMEVSSGEKRIVKLRKMSRD